MISDISEVFFHMKNWVLCDCESFIGFVVTVNTNGMKKLLWNRDLWVKEWLEYFTKWCQIFLIDIYHKIRRIDNGTIE